jgi:hypothetical protein
VHESSLQFLFFIIVLLKCADNTNLLVPEHTDISLSEEFENVKEWACDNRMIINYSKTRKLVFSPAQPPSLYLCPYRIQHIEQLQMKLNYKCRHF